MADLYYDTFPLSIVVFRNIFNMVVFVVGAVILSEFGRWVGVSYLIFSLATLFWLMRFRCKYCYYYARRCSLGLGTIVPYLFEKWNNEDFPKYAKYAAPLFLLWILPTFGGIILLTGNFTMKKASLFAFFVIASFGLFDVIREQFGCAHCRQKVNCPAYELTHKN